MSRSPTADTELLTEHLLRCVEQVPPGRVAAYGVIGRIIGIGPRQVGALMRQYGAGVPWWRITTAAGDLHPDILQRALPHWRSEGIDVRPDGRGCSYADYGIDPDAVAGDYRAAVSDIPPLRI